MTLNRILWTTVLVGATLAMPLNASLNYNEEYHAGAGRLRGDVTSNRKH